MEGLPFENENIANLSDEQKARIKEYQQIHLRLRILKMQMEDIKDETHSLLETLDKIRVEDKNKNN